MFIFQALLCGIVGLSVSYNRDLFMWLLCGGKNAIDSPTSWSSSEDGLESSLRSHMRNPSVFTRPKEVILADVYGDCPGCRGLEVH